MLSENEIEKFNEILRYACIKHEGQVRKSKEAFAIHPIMVAHILLAKGYGSKHAYTALLHDVLEDTNATQKELMNLVGDNEIVEVVVALTHKKEQSYEEYTKQVLKNDLARTVKCIDILHNLKTADSKGVPRKFTKEFVEKVKANYFPIFQGTKFENEILDELERLKPFARCAR